MIKPWHRISAAKRWHRAAAYGRWPVTQSPPPSPTPRPRARLRAAAKWALAAVVVAFVARAVWTQVSAAEFGDDLAFRWPYALAATFVLPGVYVSTLVGERFLLRAFANVRPTWRELAPAAWVPLAGKYVPGKVAAAAGAVVMLRRIGVPGAVALATFVLLDAISLLAGTVLGSALLLDSTVRRDLPAGPLAFAVVAVGGVIALHPAVFGRLTSLGLRLMRRPPLPRVPRLRDYAGPLACAGSQWAFNGLAVWLMLRAFAPAGEVTAVELPRVVSATAAVMCVSYVSAFVTPNGAGVREGAFFALLAPVAGPPAAAATAVAMRLSHLAVEAVLCGLGLLLARRSAGAAHQSLPSSDRPPRHVVEN